MPRDRMADLKQAAPDAAAVDVEGGDVYMDDFFQQVEEIRTSLEQISDNVEQLKQIQSQILSNPQNDPKLQAQLDELTASIKTDSKKVRTKLKAIESQLPADTGEGVTTDEHIRKTQHSMLSRKFVEVLQECNKVQADYKERCKGRIVRQFQISGQQIDENQVEDMIESGNTSAFTSGIITDTAQAKQTLADIEARHEDIMKLEKSIKELYEMFMDMATLVESQGEMVDRIEYNVESARANVDSAVADTKKAAAYAAAARRKKLMMIGCGLIVGAALSYWLASYFKMI